MNKIIITLRLGMMLFFVFLLFFSISISKAEAATCTASTTGNWNTAGTWTCDTGAVNHVPLSTDDVAVTSAVATTITVDTAAVANSVTVTNTAVAGTQNVILAIDGNSLTISSGGGLTISGGGATNRNAQVTNSTGTITVPGSVTFNNVRAQFISTGTSTINVGVNFGSSGTLITSGTGTINFNGSVAQTIGTYTTYNNLEINNTSGGVTFTGTTTIGGTLLVNTGTLNIGAFTTTAIGATTVNSTLQISSTTGTKTFNNNVTVNGTWSNTANEAITISGNLTVNTGATFTSGTAAYTMSGAFKTIGGTITSLTISSLNITGIYTNNILTTGLTASTALSGVGTFTQGAGAVLNIGGTSSITTFNASVVTNEVHYTGSSAQVIHVGTYHHLFIDKPGAGVGTTSGGGITVNGNLSVTQGSLADGGNQITGNATGTFTLAAGTTLTLGLGALVTTFPTAFTIFSFSNTSTVNYNSTSPQTISNITTYGNLTLTGASVTKTAAGALTVNGDFTNAFSTSIFADGGFTITVKGNSTMTGTHTGTGKILFTGGSAAHSVSGIGSYNNVELNDSNGVTQLAATTILGTLTITSGTWTSTNTISVTGSTSISGAITISSATGTKTFSGDVAINSGGAMNFITAIETVTFNGNLTINSGGTMSFSVASIIPIFGNLTVNGTGTITGTTGLWTFQKVGGGTIGGTTPALTILGSTTFATQYTLPPTFTVNTLSVSTGINETNAGTVTVNTALSGAGTFTQGASTVLNLGGTAGITTLDATVNSNDVHYTSTTANQTIKSASYYNLFINKTGFLATVGAGTTNVLGNLTLSAGTMDVFSGSLVVTGTTSIHGSYRDLNNTGSTSFGGLVTVFSDGSWDCIAAENAPFNFSNGLVNNGTAFVSGPGLYTFLNNNQNITGSSAVPIDKIVVTGIQLTNSNTSSVSSLVSLSGTGEFIQDTSTILNIKGTSAITTLTATASGNTVNYTGTAAQTVHAGTYQILNVSGNTNGSVNITADTTVNTALTLGATKFSTALNKIILALGATVSRTSGYVIGTFEKNFNSSTSFTFPVGDVSNYASIDLTLAGVSGVSSIDGSVTALDHADTTAGTSFIDKDKSVNRYWSLVNNGLTFTSYDSVFNFVSGDVDVGGTVTSMVVSKKTGGVWTILPASCSGTSCTITGITTMSDFQIGEELDVTLPTIVSVDSDGQTFDEDTPSPQTIKVTFSENISNTPTISIGPDGGIQTVTDCGDVNAKTFCFDLFIPTGTQATETITVSGAEDVNLNIMISDSSHTFIVDTIVSGGGGGGGGGGSSRSRPISNSLFPNLGSSVNNNLPNPSLPLPLLPINQPINNFLFPNAGQLEPSQDKNIISNENEENSPKITDESLEKPALFDVISKPAQPIREKSTIPFVIFIITAISLLVLFVAGRIRVYLAKRYALAHAPLRIAYYNGTEKVGLEKNMERIIKHKFNNLKTVGLSNASKLDYKGTRVIDLSGEHGKEVARVAKFVKGVVVPIPTGEIQPDADILIISGK